MSYTPEAADGEQGACWWELMRTPLDAAADAGRGAAPQLFQRDPVSIRDSEPKSALAGDLRGRGGGAAPRPSLLIWTAGITT